LPQNLAGLTNAAISLNRCRTSFPYLPFAKRRFADGPDEALQLILKQLQRR